MKYCTTASFPEMVLACLSYDDERHVTNADRAPEPGRLSQRRPLGACLPLSTIETYTKPVNPTTSMLSETKTYTREVEESSKPEVGAGSLPGTDPNPLPLPTA